MLAMAALGQASVAGTPVASAGPDHRDATQDCRSFQEDTCSFPPDQENGPEPDSDPDVDEQRMRSNHESEQDDSDGDADEKQLHSDDEPEQDDAVVKIPHAQPVRSVALSPADRRVLATTGQGNDAVLWSIEAGFFGTIRCVERRRLKGHTESVMQVAFSSDGKYIATGSYDGTVRIWSAPRGDLVHSLQGPSKEVEWILWHPRSHSILAGSGDTSAYIWWAPNGRLMQTLAGHAQVVTCGCWALDGLLVVTGSTDSGVFVWDARTGASKHRLQQVHGGAVLSIGAHPVAPLVATGSDDGWVAVVQVETGMVLATLGGHTDSVEDVRFAETATACGPVLLATASMDGTVMVWDGERYELRCVLNEHFEHGGVNRLKWLPPPHSTSLCTCSTDGTVRLFDAVQGRCIQTFVGHAGRVMDVDVALSGTSSRRVMVVSAGEDKRCRLFMSTLDGAGSCFWAGGAFTKCLRRDSKAEVADNVVGVEAPNLIGKTGWDIP